MDPRRCDEEPASNSLRQCTAGRRPSYSIKWTLSGTVRSVEENFIFGQGRRSCLQEFRNDEIVSSLNSQSGCYRTVSAVLPSRFFFKFVHTKTNRTPFLRSASYSSEIGLPFGRTPTDGVRFFAAGNI